MERKRDSCDWCCGATNKLQMRSGVGLCPDCCPDIKDEESVPDEPPHCWYNMSESERNDWLDGMSLQQIMEKYDWLTLPKGY